MQYIIDIPEHMKKSYEDMINHCDYKTFEIPRIVVQSIANGTPLPKGHGRLIDADKLQKSDLAPEPWYSPMWAYSEYEVEDAPTIIEATKESE